MTFLIESLAACALFTLFVFLMSRDPVKTIFYYPVGPDCRTYRDTMIL